MPALVALVLVLTLVALLLPALVALVLVLVLTLMALLLLALTIVQKPNTATREYLQKNKKGLGVLERARLRLATDYHFNVDPIDWTADEPIYYTL